MNFHNRLRKARIDSEMTQLQVSEFFSKKGHTVKPYTISNWEYGKRKPNIEELALLCECYKVHDALSLLTERHIKQVPDSLLLGLNQKGRTLALNFLNMLKSDSTYTENETIKEIRTYRLYDIPVSAGTGVYLDSDNYTEISGDDLIPKDADYAVRISGDSMEPSFYDGQILFIKEQQTLNNNEIGIFALNGESYVKKLVNDTLVSLNTKYKPIKLTDSDEFRIFGKVIGVS